VQKTGAFLFVTKIIKIATIFSHCTPHPNAFITCKFACSSSAPHDLLSQTNKIWPANHQDAKFSHHTTTPSQRHPQVLATHLSIYLHPLQPSSMVINIMQDITYHQHSHLHIFLTLTYPHISAIPNFVLRTSYTPLSPPPSFLIASNIHLYVANDLSGRLDPSSQVIGVRIAWNSYSLGCTMEMPTCSKLYYFATRLDVEAEHLQS
jgi:hypothetical protein